MNNKKTIIYLDLDGVIADFSSAIISLIAHNTVFASIGQDPLKGIDESKMWSAVEKAGLSFWTGLDKFTWSDELVKGIYPLGDLYFLSSPGDTNKHAITSSQASAGKTLWVAKHYPDIPIILTKHKHLLARPNSILIDDTQDKLGKFEEHGGQAFFWPHASKINTDIEFNRLLHSLKSSIQRITR